MRRVIDWFGDLINKHNEGIFRRVPLRTKGKLYASPMPFGAYDRNNKLLKIYKEYRIKHVIMLLTDEEIEKKAKKDPRQEYASMGISYDQFSIADFTAPSLMLMEDLVNKAAEVLQMGNLAVHCHAGVGRTGVALCAIVCRTENRTAEDAVAYISKYTALNMTSEQKNAVKRFTKLISEQQTQTSDSVPLFLDGSQEY